MMFNTHITANIDPKEEEKICFLIILILKIKIPNKSKIMFCNNFTYYMLASKSTIDLLYYMIS